MICDSDKDSTSYLSSYTLCMCVTCIFNMLASLKQMHSQKYVLAYIYAWQMTKVFCSIRFARFKMKFEYFWGKKSATDLYVTSWAKYPSPRPIWGRKPTPSLIQLQSYIWLCSSPQLLSIDIVVWRSLIQTATKLYWVYLYMYISELCVGFSPVMQWPRVQ